MEKREFNLEEAKAGKPVVSRDGTMVFQLEHFPAAGLLAVQFCGTKQVLICDENGEFLSPGPWPKTDNDLFMVVEIPEMREAWMNFIPNHGLGAELGRAYFYATQADADACSTGYRARLGPAIKVQIPK